MACNLQKLLSHPIGHCFNSTMATEPSKHKFFTVLELPKAMYVQMIVHPIYTPFKRYMVVQHFHLIGCFLWLKDYFTV